MSARTVAAKDLTNLRRSRAIWVVGTLLVAGVVLVAFQHRGYRQPPTATVGQLFRQLSMVVAVLLPVLALVASYLAIAGERRSGGVKFLLSVPNTRRDVFLGKLASRFAVLAVGLALAFGAAAAAAHARQGVLPVRTVLGLFGVSVAYGAVFVGLAVALSAGFATRSRAVAAAIGAYLVLVILFVVPGVGPAGLVRWLHTGLLGLAPNQDLYDAVAFVSPYTAFRKATNLVLPETLEQTVFYREPPAELPVYLTDEVSLVVLAAWLVVPPLLGYRRFARADLV